MKRATMLGSALVLAACLSFGGVAVAKPKADEPKANNLAAKICSAEKHADKAAFEETYGSKHTMRTCKRAHRPEIANASQECRAERDADPVAFEELYGTNGNKKNAFGKCVSGKVHDEETSA